MNPSHVLVFVWLLSPAIPAVIAGRRDAKNKRLILWISIPVCWLAPFIGLVVMVLVAGLNPKRNTTMEYYMRDFHQRHARH